MTDESTDPGPARTGTVTPAAQGMPFRSVPATLAPDGSLMTYFALSSLLAGPFFLFPLIPLYFRYRTLRYEIDEEGVTARWGILFRREISLTYTRIQDIHLTSNVVERWLGLAKIQVQTASGSSSAEMTIQGVPEYGALRDFLYSRMRGAQDHAPASPAIAASGAAVAWTSDGAAELAATLRDVAREMRALREALPAGRDGPSDA